MEKEDDGKLSEREGEEQVMSTMRDRTFPPVTDGQSSEASLLSIAKVDGYARDTDRVFGRQPVTTKRLVNKLKKLPILERVSPFIADYIL